VVSKPIERSADAELISRWAFFVKFASAWSTAGRFS
jgi:hypothetical protein